VEPVAAAREAERRQLTVLFCDLVDSTALASGMDPEEWREILRDYQQAAGTMVERFDGHVAQYLGDGMLIYFGWPNAHEDDAERAVRAGLAIVGAVVEAHGANHSNELAVRVGIHTGAVVVGEMGAGPSRETLAMGDTPSVAARLQGVAAPNTVVVSSATLRLVSGIFVTRELGPQTLKGFAEPVRAFEAVQPTGVRSRLDVGAATGLTPFIGREQELGLLEDRFAQVNEGGGQAALVCGEAGIGKSRLVQKFRERMAERAHTWLDCRGSPYTQDSTLHPVVELQRRGLGFRPEDTRDAKLARIEAGLAGVGFDLAQAVPLVAGLHGIALDDRYTMPGLSPEGMRKRTLALLTEWLLRLGQRQPLVLLMEDLHWMDPSTVELLGQILDQIPTAPLLLLATYRPDFEPPWGPRSYVTPMLLSRFTRSQLADLVRKAARGRDLPDAWVGEILRRADGVPLFAEELTRAVLEAHPELSKDEPIPQLQIPDTLQDSLMARLDALGPAKALAQLASVLGREFDYELLLAVSPMKEAELQPALTAAVREELFYQRGAPPEATYLFKHALIRDAAYASMLRTTRQRHHRRVAETLIERLPQVAEGQPDLVAHHWTGAGETEPAIDWWERAGKAAQARVAHEEAIRHLRSGLEQVARLSEGPARDARELDLLLRLGTSRAAARGFVHEETGRTFERARELCDERVDPRRAGIVHYYLGFIHATSGRFESGLEDFRECERIGRAQGDEVLTVAALAAAGGHVHLHLPRLAEGLECVQQACELYVPERCSFLEAGFVEDVGVTGWCWLAWLRWYAGYPEGSRLAAERAQALAERVGDPYTQAFAAVMAACVADFRRDWAEARRIAGRAVRQASEQGFAPMEAFAAIVDSWAAGVGEEDPEALDRFAHAAAQASSTGQQLGVPVILGSLAHLQLVAGQAALALQTIEGALGVAEASDQHLHDAELYRLRAECFLQLSERRVEDAEAELRRALEIARSQQSRSLELRTATSLARLWQGRGKHAEARDLLQPVYDWFSEGFEMPDLLDAKALLEELRV
jgi:class 3 adenylate cyclase/predicted ATPase